MTISNTATEIYDNYLQNPRLNTLTHSGNAERFADIARDRLRWCEVGYWLEWDGRRWMERPSVVAPLRITKQVITRLYEEGKACADEAMRSVILSFAKSSESQQSRKAMMNLAKSEPDMSVTPDIFDSSPWLFNVKNGTINLSTGELHPHSRSDYITKLCDIDYVPNAPAPRFHQFLKEVFGGDQEVIDYVQRLAGYCLTGLVSEHLIVFAWGSGRNGKTTLLEILREIIGDYAFAGSMDLVVRKREAKLDTLTSANLADLMGRRLVTVEELPQGSRLDETLIKNATGGGKINACRKYQSPFNFDPTHKLIVGTNYKPEVRGTDTGIWRRVHLLPFTQEFLLPHEAEELGLNYENLPPGKHQAHPLLKEHLLCQEAEGILAWCVEGARAWDGQHTNPPAALRAAVRQYRKEENLLGRFFDDCCEMKADDWSSSRSIRESLKTYFAEVGIQFSVSDRDLAQFLTNLGCKPEKAKGQRGWRGLRMTRVS